MDFIREFVGSPSRSTPRMMQVTADAFQTQVNLNLQVTNPRSHTPVNDYDNLFNGYMSPAKSYGRPRYHLTDINHAPGGGIRETQTLER